MKKLLLVDDNEFYKNLLSSLFVNNGYEITWVKNAKEAVLDMQKQGINFYHTIITDITMETQASGLFFAIKLRKQGFQGKIIIASTGFNFKIVLWLSRLLLGFSGINKLIPKDSLKNNRPKILNCYIMNKKK